MRCPILLVVVVAVLLLATSAFGQPPQFTKDSPVSPSTPKAEETASPAKEPEGSGETPKNTIPAHPKSVQDAGDGKDKKDQPRPKPESNQNEQKADNNDATTTSTDNGNPANAPQAFADRVKTLEERLSQLEKADKPLQPDRLPTQIVSIALLFAVAVGLILFLRRRPDKSLLDSMREVGDYIRAEDKDGQAQTETADGEPPTRRDGQDKDADELFSIIGRVGKSLLFLITFTWLLLGAIPIALGLLDTTISGTFGDTFGFVNAWFSGLALAGVILAIVMQTIELRYQRKELKQTREELARSADAAHRSQEQFTKQTELSFLSTYLGALEATAGMSPDPKDSPEYRKQRARLNIRLQTLLESLERDTLGLDLVTESEVDEAATIWAGWKQRFSDLCNSFDQHWMTKRGNNGGQ